MSWTTSDFERLAKGLSELKTKCKVNEEVINFIEDLVVDLWGGSGPDCRRMPAYAGIQRDMII